MGNNEENKIEELKVEEAQTEISQEENIIEDNRKGLSIAALVLGIVSIVFIKSFIISVACGILAIIFGNKGKTRGGKGMATAGFITGIIGLSLQVIFFLIGVVLGVFFVGLMGSLI